MSDNENDFGSDDFDLEGFDDDFDDLESGSSTLGDLWRNNAFVKIGVILLGLIILVGLFSLFGGEKEQASDSRLRGARDVTEVPGGEEQMSDAIVKATEDDNTRKLEQALRQSESFVPIPTNSTKGQIPFKPAQQQEEDPLERWRRLQEEKVERAVVQNRQNPTEVAEPEVDTRTPAIEALSEAMSEQMESILGNQDIRGTETRTIANIEYLESLQEQEEARLAEELAARQEALGGNGDSNRRNNDDEDGILVPAGTIEYAQLLTEANTDVPGPILAEIVTGPFKGGRLVGSFEQSFDFLTLNFNTIILDGVDYSANGVALDPQTTLPGVVTDINNRTLQRVILPVAAEFITGFADAISESGQTTVVISGDGGITETTSNTNDSDQEVASGVATAGTELANIIREIRDDNPRLLRVRAGTPIGVLFVDSVTNDEDEEVVGPLQALQTPLRNINTGQTNAGNNNAN